MRRKGFMGGGEGAPIKRPWLWPFPKALTSLSPKPLSLLLPISPFSSLLLHLNFYLSPRERMAFLASRVMGDQKVTG